MFNWSVTNKEVSRVVIIQVGVIIKNTNDYMDKLGIFLLSLPLGNFQLLLFLGSSSD